MSAPVRSAVATRPEAREAAEEMLSHGGSAIDAALAGYLASAGAMPWALMAPLLVVVAGVGSGVRFVDGRARQPGKGLERPRRFSAEKDVPAVSLLSVPSSPIALSLAAGTFGTAAFSQLAGYGVRAARKEGAEQRARMIEKVAQAKVLSVTDREFQSELKTRAPRIDGALLGPEDFEELSSEIAQPGPSMAFAGHRVLTAPWTDEGAMAGVVEGGRGVVLAADNRGGLAAVIFERPARTLPLYDGDIELPLLAQPLLKGVPRLRPGASLPMAMPVAVVTNEARSVALAASTRRTIDEAQLELLLAQGQSVIGWGVENAERTNEVLLVRTGSLARRRDLRARWPHHKGGQRFSVPTRRFRRTEASTRVALQSSRRVIPIGSA